VSELDRLPPKAAQKYFALVRRHEDLQGAVAVAQGRVRKAQEGVSNLPDRLVQARQRGDGETAIRLQKQIDAARKQIEAAENEVRERHEAAGRLGQLLSRCRGWLQQLPPIAELVDAEPGPVKLRRLSRQPSRAVEQLRTRIRDLKHEREQIAHALPPLSEVRVQIREHVAGLLRTAALPRVHMTGGRFNCDWYHTTPAAPSISWAQFAIWLDGGAALAKRLERSASEFYDPRDEAGLPASERKVRIKAIEEEIFALELHEEVLVMRHGIERRVDVSEPAVLGIRRKQKVTAPVVEAAVASAASFAEAEAR
jgi:hypothetical protein